MRIINGSPASREAVRENTRKTITGYKMMSGAPGPLPTMQRGVPVQSRRQQPRERATANVAPTEGSVLANHKEQILTVKMMATRRLVKE